jgi:hypothetical protein
MQATAEKIDLGIRLQPKQWKLYEALTDRRPDAPTVLGYGGSRGGGKSGGIRRIALLLAGERPGVNIWIIRRVWSDLQKDHVLPLFQEYPHLKPFYRAVDHELRIPVGDPAEGKTSSIFFLHSGDSGRSKRKARGPQAHYIFLDQAEEHSQAEMEQLAGSNRAAGVEPGFCKRCYCFNPGGQGTNYLRRIFYLREYMDNESPDDFAFIHSYGWDNHAWFEGLGISEREFYNSPQWTAKDSFTDESSGVFIHDSSERRFKTFIERTDFGKKLNGLPPNQRIGELVGSFENFSGQYFAGVFEQSSIVLPVDIVQRIVKSWSRRLLAIDWGWSHYCATMWCASELLSPEEVEDFFGITASSPVRVLIGYRELVVDQVPEPDLAKLICVNTPEAERREIRFCFIGHDAFAKRGSAHTVADQIDAVFTERGLPRLARADIDRVGGWRLLYAAFDTARRLRNWQGGPGNPFVDRQENPPALFISAACPEVLKAIPLAVSAYDPISRPNQDPKDILKMNGQASDDCLDSLRYAIKSYLTAEPGLPPEIERQQFRDSFPQTAEGNTRLANRMRALDAAQQDGLFLRRKLRR